MCAALTRRPPLSADRQQHGRHEKDVEPQVHPEEPLRRHPRSGVPPRRARPRHRLGGPHAQDVEPAEDGARQKVGLSPPP